MRKRQLVLKLASSHWNKHCLQVSVVEKSFVERSHLLDLLRRSSPWVWAAHFVSTEPVSLTQPPYIRTSKWDAFQFQPVKQRAEERQAIKECAGKEWRKWQVCCSHHYYYCCCCVKMRHTPRGITSSSIFRGRNGSDNFSSPGRWVWRGSWGDSGSAMWRRDSALPGVLAVHRSVTFNAAIDSVVSGKVIQLCWGRASVLPPIWLITARVLQLKTQFQMFKKLNMGCLRWITTDVGRCRVDAGVR